MSAEILRVHPDEPQPDRIDYIVSCLRKGGVVALPTDTFYGLAVDPVNLHAVEQIYQIKTRQKHKPLSLLISGLAQAYELARDTDPLLDKLADRFWPGPLTIIVRAGTKLPLRSTANTGNVALRVPDAAIAARGGGALRAAHHGHFGQSAGRLGVYQRRLRPRPDRRSHSAHHRRRPDRPRAAHDDRRSHAGRGPMGDSARRRNSHARNRDGPAAVGKAGNKGPRELGSDNATSANKRLMIIATLEVSAGP